MNTDTGLKLYTSYLCPYCKPVEFLLNSTKIPHEEVKMDLLNNETASEEYKKINPLQTVPAIVDNGFILYESNTLMRYLCNSREVEDHWYPKDAKKRALVDLYCDFHVQRSWDLIRYSYAKIGMINTPLEEAKKISDEAFVELENIFLKNRKYLASDDKITICDLALLWHLTGLIEAGYELSDKMKNYYESVIKTDEVAFRKSINDYIKERNDAVAKRLEKK